MYSYINSVFLKILPAWLYERLIGNWDRQGLKKYFHNTGWMFASRMFTFFTSFFTVIFVARYLGPENLGKLSYAQSLIAIFSMFASLGIDSIVYRDLVAKPEKEDEILGTAIVTKLICGVLTFITIIIVATLINDEPLLTWLTGIIALIFIFQPLGVVGHTFNAKVKSKYPSLIGIVTAIVIPLLKLTVIFTDQGIIYFAVIIAFEALLVSILNIVFYLHIFHKSVYSFSASITTFKQLIHDSWPIMFVGVTGYLYARIDQVMIQHFIDSKSVGLYEAAVRLTEPLGFLPGIVVGSVFPALINAKNQNPLEYKKRLRSLATICIGISGSLALIIFIFAPFIVHLVYGQQFMESVGILRIYIWSNVGTVATMLMYNYFIAENKMRIQLIYTTSGAVLNIVLNLIMIPLLGITGAAWATLCTVVVVVGSFLISRWLPPKIKP